MLWYNIMIFSKKSMEKNKKMRYIECMDKKTIENNKLMKAASVASIATALSLIVLKLVTFLLTGSMAILSSLFDSIQDSMTSIVNFFAVKHASEPADKEHRFGHGKAQALGAMTQGFIIAAASIFLLKESIHRLMEPQPISEIGLGIGITLFALVATFVLITFQKFVIKKTNSLSIRADMAHYTGDIMMNVGVIVSMLMAYYLKWTFVDALFGIMVAGYLFIVVYQIIKEAITILMDAELSDSFRKKIKTMTLSFPEVKEIYQLKTRQSGNCIFVQFCVSLDKKITLEQAHDITDKIESALTKTDSNIQVIIHPEPCLKKD